MSALFLTLAQPPWRLGCVAVAALVPAILAARRAGRIESIILGAAVGFVYGGIGCHWLPDAFESLGTAPALTLAATALTILWAKALPFAVLGALAHAMRRWRPSAQAVALAAALGLAQLWMGASRWGLPVLLLGHSQLSVPGVAQLAVVAGVPGLSALLVATNVAIACAVEDRRRGGPLAVGALSAWLVLAATGEPVARALRPRATEMRTLLLVQPSIDRELRWKREYQHVILDQIATQTEEALADVSEPLDAILWPENVLTTPFASDARLARRFSRVVDTWAAPLVTGLVRAPRSKEMGRYRSSIVWWQGGVGEVASVDKTRALPLVESSRNFVGRSLLTLVVGDAAGGPQVAEAVSAGALTGDFTLTPALCFEALFPGIVADRRDPTSFAIVNLADDSWVSGEVADAQLVTSAAFRAIEQRMPLVRVAHGGLSVAIDPFGRETLRMPSDVAAHRVVHVALSSPPTALERSTIVVLAVVPGTLAMALATRTRARAERAS
jgi:apolipoprotein N-acyltransferase